MKRNRWIYSLTLLILCSCQTATNKANSNQDNIIFKDDSGHSLTKNDLESVTGQVNYEILGNQAIDATAKALHDEARQLGQEGKYDSSIAKLQQAIEIQPTWAYPTYDMAYTYLLKGDFDNALKFYKKTDELEPKGFFYSKDRFIFFGGRKNRNISKRFVHSLYANRVDRRCKQKA